MMSAWTTSMIASALLLAQTPSDLRFHHLHLGDANPASRIEFYERLFDPAITSRAEFGGVRGLRTGTRLILVSPLDPAESRPSGLWHFGWGDLSLHDTYLAHARRDVVWEPPLPAEALHLHLRSANPAVAGTWFRDALGAVVGFASRPSRRDQPLPPPEHRFPDAIVRIGGITMAIYPTDSLLFSSRGQAIDHVAFACTNLDELLTRLRAMGVTVVDGPTSFAEGRLALIEGPDRIAIELLESAR
jgi:predicted enzyme related to lactoylglutathione lyase